MLTLDAVCLEAVFVPIQPITTVYFNRVRGVVFGGGN